MFNLFYVNQVFHIVILVDNVDNFVYNLIISLFADFCHVENFLDNFSLIHHGPTGFVHIARRGSFRLTDGYFFVRVEILKHSVDFSVSTFFRHTICLIQKDRLCGFYCVKNSL